MRAAAHAAPEVIARTPLLENPEASKLLTARLLIKAECVQRTGAFKFRGAYNRIRQMSRAEKVRTGGNIDSHRFCQALNCAVTHQGSTTR